MDLLVGRATECRLIRRSAREGGRGPLPRVAPSPAIFPLRLTACGVNRRQFIVNFDFFLPVGFRKLGPFLRVEARSLFQSRFIDINDQGILFLSRVSKLFQGMGISLSPIPSSPPSDKMAYLTVPSWIDHEIIDLPEFFSLRTVDCRSSYLAGPLPSLQGSISRLSRDLARKEDANYCCAQPKTALFHNNLLC